MTQSEVNYQFYQVFDLVLKVFKLETIF